MTTKPHKCDELAEKLLRARDACRNARGQIAISKTLNDYADEVRDGFDTVQATLRLIPEAERVLKIIDKHNRLLFEVTGDEQFDAAQREIMDVLLTSWAWLSSCPKFQPKQKDSK